MKILVFGNELVEEDNLVLRLMPKLQKEFPEIDFKEFDSVESLEKEGKDLIILDAVQGLEGVRVMDFETLESFDKLKADKVYSMHDFDLGYNLKLLKKLGLIDKIKVVGVGMGMGDEEGFYQIQFILRKLVAQDIQGS